ncbi:hypothetical protein BGW80DRAFT_1557073 [Lactifluus volemus]|nr:hypothetical protein BGW80DRAFT_1557073 [Lactifluus volemus]
MADSWPHWLVNSFALASQPQHSADETVYYGAYTRLLYHLFGLEGPFEISPQYHIRPTAPDGYYVVKPFTVEVNKHPVLFIEVKPPASFALDSNRKRAEDQMRDHFRNLHENLVTPRLFGITAFGTRLAFYEYEAATKILPPPAIVQVRDSVTLDDAAPAERWDYDLLEPNGIARMRQVVQDVMTMCQALNN